MSAPKAAEPKEESPNITKSEESSPKRSKSKGKSRNRSKAREKAEITPKTEVKSPETSSSKEENSSKKLKSKKGSSRKSSSKENSPKKSRSKKGSPDSKENSPQKSKSKKGSPEKSEKKDESQKDRSPEISSSKEAIPPDRSSPKDKSPERSKSKGKSSKKSKSKGKSPKSSKKGSSKKSKSRRKSMSWDATLSTSGEITSKSSSMDGKNDETSLSTLTTAMSPAFGETRTTTMTITSPLRGPDVLPFSSQPVLGYWNIRGLAEPVRYLLKYKRVVFEDRRYNFGPPPGYDFGEWGDVKAQLGLRYPGLPYYIEGETKLTQSIAIMRYLGRKHYLVGCCEEDLQEVDLMEQQVCELRWGLGRVIFSLDFDASRERYIQLLPMTLETYSIYFTVKRWTLGDDLSYVDFMMYETLDWIRVFHADAVARFNSLTEYCNRFEALPGVKEYRTSAEYVSWPIFGPLAKWGFRKRP